ncbi:MAG: Rrf2 family transcriptional regulator [Pirellulales bacterium]|nr:Rrf2 family transcriptional regulator [Pirellulales bacterium]
MKISRTVAYALQATLLLARADSGESIPCSRLAAEGKMPERFLLQILRNLVAHGILASYRGIEGGYRLTRSPEKISILDIIEAMDGPLNTSLPPAEGLPVETRIKLEKTLSDVTQLARRELGAVKLSHLLPPPRRDRSSRSA